MWGTVPLGRADRDGHIYNGSTDSGTDPDSGWYERAVQDDRDAAERANNGFMAAVESTHEAADQQEEAGENFAQGPGFNPYDPTHPLQNPDNYKPWEMRNDLIAMTDGNNSCATWLNSGSGSAHQEMSNVPIVLYTDKNNINPPDAATQEDPKAPIRVNITGRFYAASINQDLVGGKYRPGTTGARKVIMLHELAHKLNIPGFVSDGWDAGVQSMKNTQLLMDHCGSIIGSPQ